MRRLLGVLFLAVSPCWGITQVQRAPLYISSASATTHTVTYGSTPTNGNLLILAAISDAIITTPTGWTQAVAATDTMDVKIYFKTAGVSEPTAVTVTIGSSTSCALVAWEYSGMAASNQLDQTASATAQGPTSVSTGTTATTTVANELLIANSAEFPTAGSFSWNNSFTAELSGVTTNSTNDRAIATASRIVSATAAYTTTVTFTNDGNTHDSGAIATFKGAGGAGPAPNVNKRSKLGKLLP